MLVRHEEASKLTIGPSRWRHKAIDKVVFSERGCVEDQPQHPETALVLRLVPLYPHTAALRARLCQWPWLAAGLPQESVTGRGVPPSFVHQSFLPLWG